MKKKSLIKGIAFITLSGLSFSLMSVAIRLAGDLPSIQKSVFRNGIALVIAAGLMLFRHIPLRCGAGNRWLILGRAVSGTAAVLCNYFAVDHMNIGDANLLNKAYPFVTLICSSLFLKEKFTRFHLVVVAVAFGGCALIIQPTLAFSQTLPALVALLGGISAGVSMTFVRALGKRDEDSVRIVFYFSAFSTVVTLPSLLLHPVSMSASQLLALTLAGVFGASGQLFITKAYFYAAPRDISIFDYSQVVFSAVFGFLFFDQIPGKTSVLGYIIIMSMVLALFLYNRNVQTDEVSSPVKQSDSITESEERTR